MPKQAVKTDPALLGKVLTVGLLFVTGKLKATCYLLGGIKAVATVGPGVIEGLIGSSFEPFDNKETRLNPRQLPSKFIRLQNILVEKMLRKEVNVPLIAQSYMYSAALKIIHTYKREYGTDVFKAKNVLTVRQITSDLPEAEVDEFYAAIPQPA